MAEKSPNNEEKKEPWLGDFVKNARTSKDGDVIAAEIGAEAKNVAVGKNIIQIGTLQIPRYALLLLSGLLGVIAVIVAINAYVNRQTQEDAQEAVAILKQTATPTPTPTLTPTATPPVMPEGSFNIAVAELTALDANGKAVKNDDARLRSLSIAKFLQSQIDTFKTVLPSDVLIWGPEYISYPIADGEEEKSAQKLNANILVYGNLRELANEKLKFEPAFYVDVGEDNAFTLATELGGKHALGSPIDYRKGSLAREGEVNEALDVRVKALAQMLLGLSFMNEGNANGYKSATKRFEEVVNNSEWAMLEDGTGQEILYYFLGAAYLSQAYLTQDNSAERFELLNKSRQQYQHAFELNKSYARALNGLGSVQFQIGRKLSDTANPCSMDWITLNDARSAHEAALDVPDEAKPASGTVDFLAYFGMARVDFLSGDCSSERPFAPEWDDALKNYNLALADFQTISEPQPFLDSVAGYAHAELGFISFEQTIATYSQNRDATEEINRLFKLATDHYHQSNSLLQRSGTEEALRQNMVLMPHYLMTLCMAGQGADAKKELDNLLQVVEQSDSNLGSSETLRAKIIEAINTLPIVPVSWEKCQNGNN